MCLTLYQYWNEVLLTLLFWLSDVKYLHTGLKSVSTVCLCAFLHSHCNSRTVHLSWNIAIFIHIAQAHFAPNNMKVPENWEVFYVNNTLGIEGGGVDFVHLMKSYTVKKRTAKKGRNFHSLALGSACDKCKTTMDQ